MIGGYIILALVDSDWNVKLRKEDIKKTEKSRGKPAEQMTEEELYASMRQLTIKEFELTPEDKVVIDAKPNFSFSQYGTPLQVMKTSLVTAE
ncbi:MAG: hypothetical protein ACFFCW_22505 [Candidatus Hodarchaeota archaeon]